MKTFFSHPLQFFLDLPIRRKVTVIFLLIGLLPFSFFLLFSYHYMEKILLNRELSLVEHALNQSVLSVRDDLETYNNLSNYLFNNPSILSAVNTRYQEDYFSMYKAYHDTIEPLFQTYYALHPDILSITIYTSSDLHPFGGYVKDISVLENQPWFDEIKNSYIPAWIMQEEHGEKVLQQARLIGDLSKYQETNYLCITIDSEKLFAPFLQVTSKDDRLVVLDEKKKPVFTVNTPKTGARQSDSAILLSAALGETGWSVEYYKNQSNVSSYIRSLLKIIYLPGCLIFLLFCTILLLLSRTVVQPLEQITRQIHCVSGHNLDLKLPFDRRDEIGILFRSFSDMLDQLQHYIQENLKNELEKKNYQQKILYAQINPHFLYNSLSLINSKAIISGQEEISHMVLLLSSFYRTALNHGNDMATLENEITNINSYIQLQLLSYHKNIHVVYDIDRTLKDCMIPNFILQPLVENALDHGLKNSPRPEKKLSIRIAQESVPDSHSLTFSSSFEPYLHIEISDNGTGMKKEQIDLLFTKESSGYAVKNVNDRLHLLYGENCSLSFESSPDQGTCASLWLPLSSPLADPRPR